MTGESAAQNYALATITNAAGTETYFSYNADGQLVDEHENGGAEDETIAYLTPGGYTETDADGNTTTTYFDLYGAPAVTIDPLGNVTRNYYDNNLDLIETVGPGGSTYTYTLRCQRQPHQRDRPPRLDHGHLRITRITT